MARKTITKKMAEKPNDIDVGELQERIAAKAYELYQQDEGNHGHDLEHWLTAERLVQEELAHSNPQSEPRQKRTRKARTKA